MDIAHEKDVERLREAALLLEAENLRLVSKVLELTRMLSAAKGEDARVLQLRIAELEEQLARSNRERFTPSTEKRSTKKPSTPGAPQTGHGPTAQPELPIIEKVHTLDAPDQVCNSCGGQLTAWEGQFEDSEEVDVLGRKFILLKHRRQKYRCGCGSCIETALPPPKLFEGARYSIDWAIEMAIQKYMDHLPLERQVRIMKREGLEVTSQTLWDYLERLVRLLTPAHERLGAHLLVQPVIGADETRWPLLGAPDGEQAKWHAWALSSARAVFYRILDGRSAEAGRQLLGGYTGTVMADGYGVYDSLARSEGFTVAHCMSHVRREFIEAAEKYPQADAAVDLIAQLYAIEAGCPAGPEGDRLRKALRDEQSRPIVGKLQAWALEQRALPESSLGKAIRYMGGVWNGLVRFLEDPRIPLDNNATERALRGPVIGRKNHYGSRSRRGTEVAAVFYSLVESAKLCGLEPKQYLRLAVHAALRGEQVPLPHEVPVPAATPS